MEGPVRSISRMPTECPLNDRVRASCVVTLDFPTPPLPESTRIISLTLVRDMLLNGCRTSVTGFCCPVVAAMMIYSTGRLTLKKRDGDYQFGGGHGSDDGARHFSWRSTTTSLCSIYFSTSASRLLILEDHLAITSSEIGDKTRIIVLITSHITSSWLFELSSVAVAHSY